MKKLFSALNRRTVPFSANTGFYSIVLLLSFTILSHTLKAQQPVEASWTLQQSDAGTYSEGISATAFSSGSGLIAFRHDSENGAMSCGWNSKSLDTADYYQYTITPEEGKTLTITDINMDVNLDRVNMRFAVHYSTDNFRRQSTAIGNSVYVGMKSSRDLHISTQITVSYPQTLAIRVYGWSAPTPAVNFFNSNVVIGGIIEKEEVADKVGELKDEMAEEVVVGEETPEEQGEGIAAEPAEGIAGNLIGEVIETGGREGERGGYVTVTFGAAGTFTWNRPPWVTTVTIECWGGGAAGGSRSGATGGGGGGAYTKGNVSGLNQPSYSGTVGAGGMNPGDAGGNSQFLGVRARGGSSTTNRTGGAGGAAEAVGGIIVASFNGGSGGNGYDHWLNPEGGGGGGGSAFPTAAGSNGGNATSTGGSGGNGQGIGGRGADANGSTNSSAGLYPGGGGGGRGQSNSSSSDGATGRVLITYYDCTLPIKYNVTGGGAYCAGGTGVDVSLSDSESGVYYQLLLNSNPVGSEIPGTGNAISFGLQTAAGTYTVRGRQPDGGCTEMMTGSVTVTINPLPTITITNPNPVICHGTLSAPIEYSATSNGANQYSIDYNPSAETAGFNDQTNALLSISPINLIVPASAPAGTYQGTLTVRNSTTGCVSAGYPVTITINPNVVVNAGGDQEVCSTTTSVNISGSVSGGATTGTWTRSGTGTLDNPNALSTTYTFSAGDIATGSVILTLTSADPAGPCPAVSDFLIVTIQPVATVNAGPDQHKCESSPNTTLAGSIGGGATSATWSGGAGTYNPNNTTLNAIYSPTPAEITNGSVTLTLTTNDPAGSCNAVSDQVVIIFDDAPTVNAGSDKSVCADAPSVTLEGSIGGSATSATWSGGTGTYNPNNTTPNAVYTPSATEIANGTVTLTLTTNDPMGMCGAVSDQMIITINPLPVANAGADRSIYRGQSTTIGSTAVAGNTYHWTASPADGTLNPNIAMPVVSPLVTTTYTLTVTSAAGCTSTDQVIVTVTDNISISKIMTITPLKPGDPVQYTIIYQNNNGANQPALNVEIKDYLPPTALFTYTSANPAPTTNSGGVLTWNFASLPVGTYSITINGTCGSIGNPNWPTYNPATYYIMTGGGSETLSNNASIQNASTPAPIYITTPVDKTVQQYCGPDLQPNSVNGYIKSATPTYIYYSFTITNNGNISDKFDLTATGTILTFQVENLNGQSLSTTPWLAPGESLPFLLKVSISGGTPPDQTSVAQLKAKSFVCGTEDVSNISTYIYGGNIPGNNCNLQITKTPSANPVTVGNNFTYNLTITNSGDPAEQTVIEDALPPEVDYVSSTYSVTESGATVTLTYLPLSHTLRGVYNFNPKNQLNNGKLIRITIVVTPKCDAVPSITNNAKVTSSTPDLNPDNNVVSITTNVLSNLPTPAITPPAPVICSGSTVTLTASGAPDEHGYKWYDIDGNLVSTINPFTTDALTANTTFYAAIYEIANPDCESQRTPVNITILSVTDVTDPLDVEACEGETVTFSVTATGTGTLSYKWQVDTGSGFTDVANSTIYSGANTNTLTVANVPLSFNGYKYRCLVQSGTCGFNLASEYATLTVNPVPVITISGNTQICLGTTDLIYTTQPGMTNYTWNISGGTITGGAGTNSVTVNWDTPGNNWISVVYQTPEGCTADPFVLNVIVNPTPIAEQPDSQEVCNGSQTIPVVFNGQDVTSYTWTNDNVTIGLVAAGTGNIPAFTAVNTTNIPVIATITVTPHYSGNGFNCVGTPVIFTYTVNPTPTITANNLAPQICSGGSTNIELLSNVTGTTFTWTAVLQSGSNTTFNSSGSGTPITETITNLSNASSTVRYIINSNANGCPATQTIVDVVVYPTVNITFTPDPVIICSGETTNILLTSNVSNTTYTWTASTTTGSASGYSSNGSGTPIQQTINNTGNTTAVVTFVVTGTANDCPSSSVNIPVTINPAPTVSSQTASAVCSDQPIGVILNGSNNGVAISGYEIESIDSNGLTASSGPASGTINANGISTDAWTNTTGAAVNVIYTIIPVSDESCEGLPFTVTIPILPEPVGTNHTITECSGIALNFNIGSITTPSAGTTYTYTVTSSNQIEVPAGPNRITPSSANITDTYNNISGAPVTITYTITPYSTNECAGNPFELQVIINPKPIGSSNPPSPLEICENVYTNILLLSNVPGTTFTWTVTTLTGVVYGEAPGSGSLINQQLWGLGTVLYTVTPTSPAGCVGDPFTIHVTVNLSLIITMSVTGTPAPLPQPTTVCPGDPINLYLHSNNSLLYRTKFNWVNDNPSIGLAGSGGPVPPGGFGGWWDDIDYTLSFTAQNTTSVPQTAHITVTADAYLLGSFQCTADIEHITLTVNPIPTVNPVSDQSVCSGETYTPLPFETTVPGTTFTWSYTGPNIGLSPTSGTGNIPEFTAVTTTTNLIANFTVTPHYINGGKDCSGTPETFTITVMPAPELPLITGQTTICYGSTATLTATSSTPGAVIRWYDAIGGALLHTGNNFTTPVLYATTTYYVVAFSGSTNCESAPVAVTVIVQDEIQPGTITSDQTICYGDDPEPFTGDASSGSGTPAYQWQSAVGPAWTFIDIPGATNQNYDESVGLTQTTTYRRVVSFSLNGVTCPSLSNEITVTVQQQITPGMIEEDQTICSGTRPELLQSVQPGSGGTGTLSYIWQFSTDGSNFSDVVPAEMGATYWPPVLTQTTWYRRIAVYSLNGTDCNSAPSINVVITVEDNIDPQIVSCPVSRAITGCAVDDITDPPYSAVSVASTYAQFSNSTNQGFATDNCGSIASVTYIDVITNATCPYEVTRTWTVYDTEDNYDECDQIITVDETTDPIFTFCPTPPQNNTFTVDVNNDNVYLHNDDTWNASATDNCGVESLVFSFSGDTPTPLPLNGNTTLNGVVFNQGLTTVTWTATDACGNTSTCSFNVVVEGSADISVVKTVSPVGALTAGQTITYTLVVTNNGPAIAPEVILLDNMADQVIEPTTWTLNGVTQTGSWPENKTFTNLAVGATGQQTIVITAKVSCDPINLFSNTATVHLSLPFIDANTANNTSTVSNSIINPVTITGTATNGDCESNGSIDITASGGTPPYSYAWTGPDSFTSSAEDLTGLASGVYEVTVTDANGCTVEGEWTVTSEDLLDPTFTLPNTELSYCVNNIIYATYNPNPTPGIIPEYDDLTTPRPEYYIFLDGSDELDLDPVINNFNDDCCTDEELILHWRIVFSPTPNPSSIAHELITLPDIPLQTGMPSDYGEIRFPGDGVYFNDIEHYIYYSLEDCNGNISEEQIITIVIKPRPNVIKQP